MSLASWHADVIADAAQQAQASKKSYSPHEPFGRQKLFLIDLHDEREAFYGGAAGGMKSDALLQCALEYADVPGYAALILRRTYKQLSKPGALMDRAQEWLRNTSAKWNEQDKQWRFPVETGPWPVVQFGYLENENDKFNYQSAEFQLIAPDELTQYTETQYTYLFSRLRRPAVPCMNCRKMLNKPDNTWIHAEDLSLCTRAVPDSSVLKYYSQRGDGMTVFDIPLRMRTASNPASEPTGYWVTERFIPDDFTPEDAIEPRIFWKEKKEKGKTVRRPFVPSRLTDNPFIDQKAYRDSLSELDDVTELQLAEGDWQIKRRGNIYPMWDEQYHVVSWSEFKKVFGADSIPLHWNCGISQDWGTAKSHPCVTTLFATAAANSPMPGCVFIAWGLTLYDAQDAQQVGNDYLIPELDRLHVRDRIKRWLMSHEAKSERNGYRKMHLPFVSWGLDVNGGIDQVRRYLKITNKNKLNPFGKLDRFHQPLMGHPTLMLLVADEQLANPRDDKGLARHRAEFAGYSYYVPKAGDAPAKLRPQMLFQDAMDTIRCYAEIEFPSIKPLTEEEKIEQLMPEQYKAEAMAALPETVDSSIAAQGRYQAYHEAKRTLQRQQGRTVGPYGAAQQRYPMRRV